MGETMKKIAIDRKSARRLSTAALSLALACMPPALVNAEDIDLFVGAAATAATNPNILIIIDNSANWASNSQHWEANRKQGESELRALKTILSELDVDNPRVNLGVMMFTEGQGSDFNGAYVRFHVREMNRTNRDALVELIGADSGCVDGANSLNGTPNCILKNFQGGEQVGTAKLDYSGALFEAYKYLGGWSSPAYAQRDQQPAGALNDQTHHGLARYAGTAPNSKFDAAAYVDANKNVYRDWITNACGKNYVIFVGNGFPSQDDAGPLIANVNGGSTPLLPAQFAMQNFTVITSTETTNLGTASACQSPTACASAAQAQFGSLYDSYSCTGGNSVSNQTTLGTDPVCELVAECVARATTNFPGFTSYSCSGGNTVPGSCTGQRLINQTMIGTDASITPCIAPNRVNQTQQGTKTVNLVTPLQTFSTPTTSTIRYTDEWAQFLYTTDVNDIPGQQNASVYTIDVFKDQQDQNESALLFNMAKYGGGRYFQAQDESSIINALRQIMIEIQSVNSVFASASLPINATNRSQNENQVFIGMFRPEGTGNPRWYGNLKRYQIAQFGQEFKLGDASSPPLDAVSPTTGFLQPCARSFWTVDSDAYWFFQNGSSGQCSTSGLSSFSDSPDGPQVEKGAVAEVIRRGNNPPSTPGALSPQPGVNRTLYTCATPGSCCPSCGTNPETTLVTFDTTNVSKTQLGNAAMSDLERDNIVNFTRGQDIFDANNNTVTTDVQAAVHGDVAHSRPLPVNYGGTTGVVLYYGANDGTFRAVQGSDGKELWAFLAPEQHSKLKRLADNSPRILYPSQIVTLQVLLLGTVSVGDMVTGATSGAVGRVTAVDLISSPNELTVTNITDAFLPGEDFSAGGSTAGIVLDMPGVAKKDYFFDGSAGLFQNADDSKIWVYPSMRRGGRMIYAFNVTAPQTPSMMWKAGCADAALTDTSSCTPGFEQMGQTWSTPSVALVKGFSTDVNSPVIIVGGGYDTCDDQDAAPNTACTATGYARRGNRVYVINASNGALVKEFATVGSVPGDVTLVDRDFDGFADHAYAADTSGRIYRIDFVDPASPSTVRASTAWTITQVAHSTSGNRKFLFPPGTLPASDRIFLSIASGDRERPLIINYPYVTPVTNRAYMVMDEFSGTSIDLDSASMDDLTSGSSCSTASPFATGKSGWFIDLNNGTGEQAVTSSTIFSGLIFFSTNRPLPTPPGACANNLGEARGYALNLLNASGAADTLNICGGSRSSIFVGGGLPPSPVTGTVPVGPGGRPVTVMIGGVQRSGGASSPIGAQRVTPSITQRRSRVYWYTDGDK
jgi:type IV pilus assembly protein PilY1